MHPATLQLLGVFAFPEHCNSYVLTPAPRAL